MDPTGNNEVLTELSEQTPNSINDDEVVLENLELNYFPIMTLPQEIRGVIYSLLPQEQVVQVRLVSQQWRREVDEMYDFDGVINDELPYWERILQLRLVSCDIRHFLQDPPNYGLPATKIFKYPHLLKKLKITTSCISSSNFYYILSDYGRNLVELSLVLTFPILNERYTTSLSKFNLKNLTKLELTVSLITDNPAAVAAFDFRNTIDETIFTQLMSNPLESLKYLKLELRVISFKTISRFQRIVFSFLASHHALETLDFELIQGNHGIPILEAQPLHESDTDMLDFDSLRRLCGLKSLRIVSSSSVAVNIWLDIMSHQNFLTSFEVDVLPAPQPIFMAIISNNFESLLHLEITDLTIWNDENGEPTPFDLTLLGSCTNLRKLLLDRNVLARRRFEVAELVNLNNLPTSLVELALNYFNVLTHDFYLYFSSIQLTVSNLSNVTITQCGNSGHFGINGSALDKLISLESIVFVEISRFNFGQDENDEEYFKLNMILTRFGYNENHSYFQYSKIQNILNGLNEFVQDFE